MTSQITKTELLELARALRLHFTAGETTRTIWARCMARARELVSTDYSAAMLTCSLCGVEVPHVDWPKHECPGRCDHKFVDSTHCLKCGVSAGTLISRRMSQRPPTPSARPMTGVAQDSSRASASMGVHISRENHDEDLACAYVPSGPDPE